jgi:hypothetical protein
MLRVLRSMALALAHGVLMPLTQKSGTLGGSDTIVILQID